MITIVWRWWLFLYQDIDTISFDISSQSIEMFNFMEGSHGCKAMEYPVVGTNHLNFVYLCDNITCWPLFGVGDCSKSEIWVQYHTISFDVNPQSMQMFNFMEMSHGCKVMEYTVVGTYHFNCVRLCCNITWWPFYGVGDSSKNEMCIQYHSILIPSQRQCSTSWKGLIVLKLWSIQ